jgi:hypothetical protein
MTGLEKGLLHLSHVPALQVKSGQCSTLNLVEVSSGLQLSLSGHVRPNLIHLLSRQFEHHGTKKNWPYKTGDLLKEVQFI